MPTTSASAKDGWDHAVATKTGIEVPGGDPSQLLRAAIIWGAAAETLRSKARMIEGSVLTKAIAHWEGRAAAAAAAKIKRLCAELRRGAHECQTAATACGHFANQLRDAQGDAKHAIRDARDALDRIAHADKEADRGRSDAEAAEHRAARAKRLAEHVQGSGVLSAGLEQGYRLQEQAARQEAGEARRRVSKAGADEHEARGDLRRARERGAAANRHAEESGRRAAHALSRVEGAAGAPRHGHAPTPPSGGGSHYPLGKHGPLIGTPYVGTHRLGNWQSDNAVDISVPVGTPMLALDDGVVVKVDHHPQDGSRFAGDGITIRGADGNMYFYKHGVAGVHAGQKIRDGQVIGTTGSASGSPHLHFAVKKGDPRKIIALP
jgi:murein DD-endopeptidase MepM/ murein hydrolase activator NlpD